MKKINQICLVLMLSMLNACGDKPAEQPTDKGSSIIQDLSTILKPKQIDATLKQQRIALVIGNADYIDDAHWRDLPSDKKDAEDVAKALESFGFEVILKTDLSLKEMHKALLEFSKKLDKNTEGLIYYSGHGTQIEGRQYLIPIDSNAEDIPQDAKQVDESLLSTFYLNVNSDLLARIENKARVTILILDACRTSLFKSENEHERMRKGGTETFKSGFDKFEGKGILIASSTASGTISIGDTKDKNSVYTAALLKLMKEQPQTEIRLLLGDVGTLVKEATKNSELPQEPWVNASFDGRFYFAQNSDEEQKWKEEEARQKAEEDRRLQAELEAKQKAEEEARLKAEEEAKLKAAEVGQPNITIGDTYVYRSDRGNNKDPVISKRTVTDNQNGSVAFSYENVKKKDKPRTLYYDNSWNLKYEDNFTSSDNRYNPALKFFDFPLYPGKEWTQTTTQTIVESGKEYTYAVSAKVEQWEDITVPAGQFHALKIVSQYEVTDNTSHKTTNNSDTSWYAPEVRRSVKTISQDDKGTRVIELLEYNLAASH